MAEWKKVIVSGSDAELNHLKISEGKTVGIEKSPIQFDTISGSTSVTPIVIDADGNLFTGSEYAKASGGNTVGGSGLSQSVAIVGLNEGDPLAPGSQIQTASSAIPFNLNSANVQNAGNITSTGSGSFASVSSSTGYTIHTSSFASISDQTLTVGSNTLTTHITASNIILEASGGITASVVPESLKPTFYLGIGTNGEIEKVAESNVQGSGGGSSAGVTGITTCSLNSNINLSVTQTAGTETEEYLNLGRAYLENDGNVIYLLQSSFFQDDINLVPSGSLIRLKGYDIALGQFIEADFRVISVDPIEAALASGENSFGINIITNGRIQITADTAVGGALTNYTPASDGDLIRAEVYLVTQDVSTGVVEICLNEDLFLNDIIYLINK